MLAPLDNETIFKKAFTNKIVFTQFVKDIFGIDVEVDKIETEKRYEPKAGFVDLAIDIFAETVDHRFIIEIQRIDYDHNFDRFLHYFLQTITEQQKSSKDYTIEQEVLTVVILTQPYIVNKKTGEAVQDNVMTLDFDLKNLKGNIIKIWGHRLVFLNPHPKYKDPSTPKNYEDWLELIRQSVQQKETYTINLNNKGIAKVVEIIDYERTTPEERRLIKITEGKRIMKIKEREMAEYKGEQKAKRKYGKLLEEKEQAIQQTKKELQQKEQAIQQTKKELQQKDQAIQQTKKELQQKDQALAQKDQALINSIKLMKSLGAGTKEIQQLTGLSEQEINLST